MPDKLRRFIDDARKGAAAGHQLVGWFSFRRDTPLLPSVREVAVCASLAKASVALPMAAGADVGSVFADVDLTASPRAGAGASAGAGSGSTGASVDFLLGARAGAGAGAGAAAAAAAGANSGNNLDAQPSINLSNRAAGTGVDLARNRSLIRSHSDGSDGSDGGDGGDGGDGSDADLPSTMQLQRLSNLALPAPPSLAGNDDHSPGDLLLSLEAVLRRRRGHRSPARGGGRAAAAAAPNHLPPITVPLAKPLDVRDRFGCSPLALAAAGGHFAVVRDLMLLAASPGLPDNHGNTPLMLALRNGHVLVAEFLVKALRLDDSGGVHFLSRPNARNKAGETALLLAARGGHARLVRMLVNIGCKRARAAHDGETALHVAAARGDSTVMKLLLLMPCTDPEDDARLAPAPGCDGDGDAGSSTSTPGRDAIIESMHAAVHMEEVRASIGMRKGIGEDGRGGYFHSCTEPVTTSLVDAHGRTPASVAADGAARGIVGCGAVLELLRRGGAVGVAGPGAGSGAGSGAVAAAEASPSDVFDDTDSWAEDDEYCYESE